MSPHLCEPRQVSVRKKEKAQWDAEQDHSLHTFKYVWFIVLFGPTLAGTVGAGGHLSMTHLCQTHLRRRLRKGEGNERKRERVGWEKRKPPT